jgi:hypothetical protein
VIIIRWLGGQWVTNTWIAAPPPHWVSSNPDPSSLAIYPGQAFFIQNNDNVELDLAFGGEVLEGSLVHNVPAGVSYAASMVPQARPLGMDGEAGTLQFPAAGGDQVALYNNGFYTTYTFDDNIPGWTFTDPVIGLAEGFYIQKAPPGALWTQNFVVSSPCGPRLTITRMLPEAGIFTITWPESRLEWQLQSAPDPEGPWSRAGCCPDYAVTVTPGAPARFYRLLHEPAPVVPILCSRLSISNTFDFYWRMPGYQLQKRLYSASSWSDVPDVPVLEGGAYHVSLDDLAGWVIERSGHLYFTNNCINSYTFTNVAPCARIDWFVTNSSVVCRGVSQPANVFAYCTNWMFHTTGYGWYLTTSAGITPDPGYQYPTFNPTNEPTFFRLRKQ